MARARSGRPVLEILGIFVGVFVLQVVAATVGLALLAGLFVLSPPIDHRPWTVLTSVYAHGGVGHLVSNGVALVLFGWPIARATTRLRFHAYFLATGAIAGIAQIVLTARLAALPWVPIEPTAGVWGASGAVFALLGYLIAANRLSEGLAGFVDVGRGVTLLAFLALAVVVTWATGEPGVALVAHFTGLFAGLVAGQLRLLRPSRSVTGGR